MPNAGLLREVEGKVFKDTVTFTAKLQLDLGANYSNFTSLV